MSSSDAASEHESSKAELRRLVELSKLDVGCWDDITILNLTGCSLTSLPQGFEKAFPNLSILFLSNNSFREMPAVIGACPKLQMVAFKSNQMASIHPDALQPQLRWLILTDNNISTIPDTIGRCSRLQKFMLSGNQIQELPESIQNCTSLELIRLASNRLAEPPVTLLQLPRLAWVALSDNPFLDKVAVKNNRLWSISDSLPVLSDIDEETGDILGQGAGGITRKLFYNGKPVAVKTASRAMTSDGLPSEERRVSCAASTLKCPALIKVLGQTQQTGSLVMEFLDDFAALADPPSFETCSRDVYDSGKNDRMWTTEEGETMVSTLLHALKCLHKVGICHGDFYGHNILVKQDDKSQVRLSDFGAAFFYERFADGNDCCLSYGELLERTELRAFAVLVEEVNHSLLLDGPRDNFAALVNRCRSEQAGGFENVYIWWKQQQLAGLAQVLGAGVDESVIEETKE